MLVTGEVKCLHCGHISGRWLGPSGAPVTESGFTPGQPREIPADPNGPVHCLRCNGPVLLDEATLVISSYRLRRIRRLREQIAALDTHRPRAA